MALSTLCHLTKECKGELYFAPRLLDPVKFSKTLIQSSNSLEQTAPIEEMLIKVKNKAMKAQDTRALAMKNGNLINGDEYLSSLKD